MFQCDRCGFEAASKWSLKCHFERKKPCLPIRSDADPASLLAELRARHSALLCELCGREFSCAQSKYLHKKRHCEGLRKDAAKVAVESEEDKTTTNKKTTINVIYNNTTVNNGVIVNSTVNAFGKETTDHLSNEFLDRCVKRTGKGLLELIETIHFDPRKPQNRNIRALNTRQPFVEYNDGKDRWLLARKDKVVSELFDKGTDIMQNHFDEHEDRLSEQWSQTMFEHVKRWLEKMETVETKTLFRDLLQDIYLLILNHSRK